MDISLLSALLTAVIAFVTSIVTTLWTLQVLKKREEEKKYQEKIEEIQELAIKVNSWLDIEFEGWWLAIEYSATRTKNKLECPIENLTMLAERYEPSLNQSIAVIAEIIVGLKNSDLDIYEEKSDEQYYYNTRIFPFLNRLKWLEAKCDQSLSVLTKSIVKAQLKLR